jgi:toxin YoeB
VELIYSKRGAEDRVYWENQKNEKVLIRIDALIEAIRKDPFSGIGKPEPLQFEKSGYWSRRINKEHRLVYKVVNKKIYTHRSSKCEILGNSFESGFIFVKRGIATLLRAEQNRKPTQKWQSKIAF